MQAPAPSQVSPPLQGSPSLQLVPAGFGVVMQPRAGSQLAVKQGSVVVQVSGLPPPQVPDVQVWIPLQRLSSSHTVPSGASGFEQMPVSGLHVPATWQPSSAVQTVAVPPWQTPAWQVVPVVQALVSSQAVPFALSCSTHVDDA